MNNENRWSSRSVISCLAFILLLFVLLTHSDAVQGADGYYLIDVTGGDCLLIGTWDPFTRTCTLTDNTDMAVRLKDAQDVTLDGAGYTIPGILIDNIIEQGCPDAVRNVVTTGISIVMCDSPDDPVIIENTTILDSPNTGILAYESFVYIRNSQIINAADTAIEFLTSCGHIENTTMIGSQQTDLTVGLSGANNGCLGIEVWHSNFIHLNEDGMNVLAINDTTIHQIYHDNYYSGYDTGNEGCSDVDINGVCDTPLLIGNYEEVWFFYDESPVTRRDAWLPPTVNAGGPYSVLEGDNIELTASGSDPSDDPLSYAWDLDNDGFYETAGQSVIFHASTGSGIFSVTVQVTDYYGDTASAATTVEVEPVGDTQPPHLSDLNISPNPAPQGQEIAVTTIADDSAAGASNIATAEYSLDNMTWTMMTAGDGTFDSPVESVGAALNNLEMGLYNLCLRVSDTASNLSEPKCELVVIYDPYDGFVTGHAVFNSPAGAYTPDQNLSGEAVIGFVSKYRRGATVPSGHTRFQFEAAGLSFYSNTFEWLVVAPRYRAMFRGVGSVNGMPGYIFTVWAIDGQLDGSGVDKVRIRIWNEAGILYDNELEKGIQDDPTTVISNGNIMIHKP